MTSIQFKNLLSVGWPMDSPRLVIPWKSKWQDLLTLPDVDVKQWKRWKNGKELSYCSVDIKNVSIECLSGITACSIGPITVPTEDTLKEIRCSTDSMEGREELEKQLTDLFGPVTLVSGTLEDKGGPIEYQDKVWVHRTDKVTIEFVLTTGLEVRIH